MERGRARPLHRAVRRGGPPPSRAGPRRPTRRGRRLPPPNVKFVLCIREDFIGQLEELAVVGAADHAAAIPARRARPRTRRRRRSASRPRSTTRGCARSASRTAPARRRRSSRSCARRTSAARRCSRASIDPSQLQIICQHVERSILPAEVRRTGRRDRDHRERPRRPGGPAQRSSATSTDACSRTFPQPTSARRSAISARPA